MIQTLNLLLIAFVYVLTLIFMLPMKILLSQLMGNL